MARVTARAAVMQMIYEHLAGGEGGEETLQMVYDELRAEGVPGVEAIRDNEPGAADRAYITRVLDGVVNHLDELDGEIEAASRDWRVERMPKVDLTILRLATWEILHEEDVPGSVASSLMACWEPSCARKRRRRHEAGGRGAGYQLLHHLRRRGDSGRAGGGQL